MTTFTFSVNEYDDVDGTNKTITHEFSPGDDCSWGPVVDAFYDFLKGNGYVFDINSRLTVVDEDGEDTRLIY